jgi:hypothetical protein
MVFAHPVVLKEKKGFLKFFNTFQTYLSEIWHGFCLITVIEWLKPSSRFRSTGGSRESASVVGSTAGDFLMT